MFPPICNQLRWELPMACVGYYISDWVHVGDYSKSIWGLQPFGEGRSSILDEWVLLTSAFDSMAFESMGSQDR